MAITGIPESMLCAQVVEVIRLLEVTIEKANIMVCQQFHKPYQIHEVPTPRPLGPYDVLLKVAVASLCHTDGMVSAGIMGTKLPCIGSHEGAGTVVDVGSSVTELHTGDRVMAGLPRNRCGHCPDCLGDENYRQYCPNIAGHVGVTLDGAFAEFMIVDSRESARIPDDVSFETAAPLACAGCTIWRGVLHAELKKGETIAIIGAGGGLGHLGCQFAKALGLMVVGIDAREEGLALARDSGADVVVDARKENVVAEVMNVTNGQGADATVNISDNVKAAALACAVTKMQYVLSQPIFQMLDPVMRRVLGVCTLGSCAKA